MGKRNVTKVSIKLKHARPRTAEVVMPQVQIEPKIDQAIEPKRILPKEPDRELTLVMPHRHRREKKTEFLSKGQKKRLVKKAQIYKRITFANDISQKSVIHNQKSISQIQKDKFKEQKHEKKFLLNSLDEELSKVIGSVKAKDLEVKKPALSNSKNRRAKISKLIEAEKDKIMKVLDNKNFQANPVEAMRNHIYNSQILEQRKKESALNFQKYNK